MTNEPASLAVTANELAEILANSTFAATYGFELGAFGSGWCEIRVPYNPRFERPGGIVSGPVFMAAADVAAWFAIKTLAGADDPSVTVDMTTSFLESLREADFLCRAEVVKAASASTFLVARCIAGDGRVLTHHTLRYLRSTKSPTT
jgi:acyl-coenzyme A thioesterase PaaI-like protein